MQFSEVGKMNIGGFIKRMLPFVAAFAVGVFIASFFVDLSKPRFGPRAWRGKRHHEMQRLRVENEELRNENLRLKNQLENQDWRFVPSHPELHEFPGTGIDGLPAPPPVAPIAPVAPKDK